MVTGLENNTLRSWYAKLHKFIKFCGEDHRNPFAAKKLDTVEYIGWLYGEEKIGAGSIGSYITYQKLPNVTRQ